jgi:hypothetical protein
VLNVNPLRLMIYDRTCGALTASWWVGGHLARAMGRLDGRAGFDRWADALRWLRARSDAASRPIGEIQYWGHGHPGYVRMARDRLDRAALAPGHPLHDELRQLRDRLLPGGQALFWFRTCQTFAGPEGHAFARDWTRFFSARTAGHTFIIGPLQSGLHVLAPGEEPSWPVEEGGHAWSSLRAPATISFLQGTVTPGPLAGSGAGRARPPSRRP